MGKDAGTKLAEVTRQEIRTVLESAAFKQLLCIEDVLQLNGLQ